MKGYIIVIEGTDGCGKQTQTKLLYDTLVANYNVIKQSFPNYESESSGPVKMYLSGEFGDANSLDAYQSSSLFAVDRLCTYTKQLKQHYENGEIIIFDRYTTSNMLHQASKIKNKEERDKYLEWLAELEYNTLKLPRPDMVIFLDVPVKVSKRLADERGKLKTGGTKDVHESDVNHLQNAYESGKYVAKKYNWKIIQCVDENENLKSIEQIHNQIVKCIDIKHLPKKLDKNF